MTAAQYCGDHSDSGYNEKLISVQRSPPLNTLVLDQMVLQAIYTESLVALTQLILQSMFSLMFSLVNPCRIHIQIKVQCTINDNRKRVSNYHGMRRPNPSTVSTNALAYCWQLLVPFHILPLLLSHCILAYFGTKLIPGSFIVIVNI
jgi:hypothetical protein